MTNDVEKPQLKFYQNRIGLRGGKYLFFGHWYLQKGVFLGLPGTIISQIITVEQTIKKLCDFQVMGGVEESEARNYLPNKEKSQFFVIFTNLMVFGQRPRRG